MNRFDQERIMLSMLEQQAKVGQRAYQHLKLGSDNLCSQQHLH